MQGIEQLVRESLTARAHDVEPTPLLWLEVERRVARRRRLQVAAWSLAGAAAALAAVLAIPAIVGTVTGDRSIDIEPLVPTPAGGVVGEYYATVADGRIEIRDLATGELRSPVPTEDVDRPDPVVEELAVRPGSSREGGAVAALRSSGAGDQYHLEVVSSGRADDDGTLGWLQSSAHSLEEDGVTPGFVPSITWTPDQDRVAFTLPEGDQTKLVLWQPGASRDGVVRALWEPGVVLGIGDVVLLDWYGRTTSVGDESVLVFRDDLGVHLQSLTVAEGGMVAGDSRILDGAYDVAAAHADAGSLDAPMYAVQATDAGLVLRWTTATASVDVPLADTFGEVDPAELWIDAKQDAALVGDGARTWLLAHDGAGAFTPPVEIEAGSRAALFDAPRPAAQTPEPDPEVEPTDEPAPDPTADGDPGGGMAAPGEVLLPVPVVTVTQEHLVLHGPDGEQVLYTLSEEGHSTFLSIAVRPGSTVDDLTMVALHHAEGMHDLRTYRYVDGELSVEYWDRDDLQVGFGGEAGDAVAAFGPVWHPAGDKLAWIELGTGGTPNLRIIGWTDDGPGTGNTADDNASWPLEQYEGVALKPVDWVDLGGGRTELRAVSADGATQWVAIPIEIQADNAAALTGGAQWQRMVGDGPVYGMTGAMDDGTPRWMLRGLVVAFDPMGESRKVTDLPEEFLPGEGIPDIWMRPAGDGFLVGISNTGTAYYGSIDEELARVGGDGIVGGDVVR